MVLTTADRDKVMNEIITLIPPFGRDFTSAARVYQAWRQGKPFRIVEKGHKYYGKYCTIHDMDNETVRIKFKKKTLVTLIGPGE